MTASTTFKSAKAECTALGCRLFPKSEWGEFRLIDLSDDREAAAYYTDDLDDAVGTARQIARRR